MWKYILKRILYAIPILIGVNIITFTLFFIVNTPDDIARLHLGNKYISNNVVDNWKKTHGYDLPLFINKDNFTKTIFFQKSYDLFKFNFGMSDNGRNISKDIKERYLPSLLIAIPSLLVGLLVNITVSIVMAFFRGTYLDAVGLVIAVILMSVSSLFYIVSGQYLLAKICKLFPISGFSEGIYGIKFLILPVIISVVSGVGSGSRWYRSFFLEELNKDYVKTARSKGLSETIIFGKHILKNAMLPILTGVVVILPLLFMGSLITESFFAIPGLGSYTIDAIKNQDFAIVRVMVFLGSFLYILGLLLTDLSYVLFDPRVKLK